MHFSPRQLAAIPIIPDFLLDIWTTAFLISLGRPLWSSLKLSEAVLVAAAKLNLYPQSKEANLVHFLLRADVNSAPDSQLAKTMVKSYMASLVSVSKNTSTLKLDFCSEPIFATASRLLSARPDKRRNIFTSLLKAAQNNVIDRGRLLELMFAGW